MKKIIITSLILCLTVMVTTTLSEKNPSEKAAENGAEADRKPLKQNGGRDDGLWQRMQEKAAEQRPIERSKVEERLVRQRKEFEQNLYNQPIKILTDMHYVNQQNLQRIQVLEGKIRLLEERLKILEANEKKNFYQRKKLETQLRSLQERRFWRD